MTASGSLFSHRHNHGARVWSAQRRKAGRGKPGPKRNLDRIHRFDDLLADGQTPEGAATQMGFSASYGRVMLAKIRGEINEAQRAAGYGDWAV